MCMYMYVCIYIYVYIYVYIERDVCLYIYIYIYIYIIYDMFAPCPDASAVDAGRAVVREGAYSIVCSIVLA